MPRLPALPRPEGHVLLSWLGIAVLAGIAIGAALLPRARDDRVAVPTRVALLGRSLPLNDQASETALSWVRERLSGSFALDAGDGTRHAIGYGALGVELDRTRLREFFEALSDPSSSFARRHRSLAPEDPAPLVVPVRLNPERAVPALLALKDQLDRPARDARLDLAGSETVAERVGRLLDVDASLRAIQVAIESGAGSAELAFERIEPKRRASELARIDHATVLGAFETPYDRSSRATARTFNLRLAASRLDGTVVLPGQEFDFNRVVGPRDEANGYQVAKVIAAGELVDGIGGGTCQISGTLHAAALLAGLDIVERTPHTRPSAYIKLGLDATVVYPTINFRFANPYDFPVVVHQRVEDGVVRAEIRGARRPKRVTLVRRVVSAAPFAEIERPDPDLPRGVRRLSQQGVPGLALHRYRVLREGRHAVRERVVDRYPPTPEIVRVGVGPAEGTAPRELPSSDEEYAPDELLVIAQAPEPGGSLRIHREPGRFGRRGWTRNLVSPAARPGSQRR